MAPVAIIGGDEKEGYYLSGHKYTSKSDNY